MPVSIRRQRSSAGRPAQRLHDGFLMLGPGASNRAARSKSLLGAGDLGCYRLVPMLMRDLPDMLSTLPQKSAP